MTTFIDTNVLIAILDPKDHHHKWSVDQLLQCKAGGPAVICDMVYCEFSVGMLSRAAVDAVIAELALQRFGPTGDDALYRAGQAFKEYRQKKGDGKKDNVLPDFLIGAVAEVQGAPLLTANKKDYVGYFPHVKLISPS